MSIWSKDYLKCRECMLSTKRVCANGRTELVCSKDGTLRGGCEIGTRKAEGKYLFQNYKRRITFV